ncbi:MAG TPA: branched-chain-amino-acid transaminase, partial [Armatimonadota bacterium]|nr:branched-chain-amino-acid transaminase [Armatimonadota bacterium]
GLVVYLDGELVPEEQARVSVFDHGVLYGDGVFEGIRVYHSRIFRLEQHLQRLYDSARGINLDIPIAIEEMEQACVATVEANGLEDAYIRLVVTRGVGDLGLDPRKCAKPTVFIIVGKIQLYDPELYVEGIKVITCETRRTPANSLSPRIKSLNYLNNILGKIEVAKAGVEEGIMLNQDGYVAECTADNIFLVNGKRVVTPPPEAGMLLGVTRGAVIEVARERGYEVVEELFQLEEVLAADECFLTGTGAEIVPVTVVDGQSIGSGKAGHVTNDLREGFQQLVAREGTPVEIGVR